MAFIKILNLSIKLHCVSFNNKLERKKPNLYSDMIKTHPYTSANQFINTEKYTIYCSCKENLPDKPSSSYNFSMWVIDCVTLETQLLPCNTSVTCNKTILSNKWYIGYLQQNNFIKQMIHQLPATKQFYQQQHGGCIRWLFFMFMKGYPLVGQGHLQVRITSRQSVNRNGFPG